MSFEDRVRSTVDQAVAPLVQQLLARPRPSARKPSAPRRSQIFEEAEQAAQTRVADAEARGPRARWTRRSPRPRRGRSRHSRARDPQAARSRGRPENARRARSRREPHARCARGRRGEGRRRSARPRSRPRASRSARSRWPASPACSKAFAASMARPRLSEVLDALALAAAREAARAAVVVLRKRSHPGLAHVGIRSARLAAEIDRSCR